MDVTPALARAVAAELNDELTMILNSVRSALPAAERLGVVEDSSLRCAVLTRRLLAYADRRSSRCRPIPLDAILDDAA